MSRDIPRGIDRYTLTTDLAPPICRLVKRSVVPLGVVLTGVIAYLAATGSEGVMPFALISIGSCIALSAWAKSAIGLPLMPIIILQHLFAYAMPIVVGNETLSGYSSSTLLFAGVEVLIFLIALIGGWTFGMRAFSTASSHAYTLHILNEEGSVGLRRIGYALIALTSSYYLLQSLNLLNTVTSMLPSGSDSLINALVSAAGMCGFFVIALAIGSREIPSYSTGIFWALFAFNCLVSASSLLLSSTTSFVATVCIGLFWGSGRFPWKFMTLILLILGFLSLGKFEMRNRHWDINDDYAFNASLTELPGRYIEWADASMTVLTSTETDGRGHSKKKDNSMLTRINNLQNLLFVIDAADNEHIPLLLGSTYTLIPPLLVPRVLWPDKPRTHEGQVMLNVHFGRQDLISSYRTYIAWGLLPEAYGNFGRVGGSVFLGMMLGGFIAWVEKKTANKPVLSMEGFLVFTLFLNMAASFEMVASVLVTSIFQSLIPVALACVPFVYRSNMARPEEEESA